ncbi:hypothetical protein [Winogradskyella sp. PE311]|uniref:hypothetical protein n=1 Tax=Winogradskyella sp. PE311 TaxID=3366943 RepID=UPI0039809E1B
MKKLVLLFFVLFLGFNLSAQMRRNRGARQIPQTNQQPSDQEIAKRERMIEERKAEFIANFISTLEADDFQKEIIKQYLNSYFDKKLAVLKLPFERSFEREQAVKKLDDSHFLELAELISEADMLKIKGLIKGEFDEKEQKKKKKKRKRKNKN